MKCGIGFYLYRPECDMVSNYNNLADHLRLHFSVAECF